MAEQLDGKLPEKWNTIPSRKLIIWLFHRISLRLEALETKAGITPPVVDENVPDMNKIKRPTTVNP